jgi:hypothetical protein
MALIETYKPGLGLIGTGAVLWLLGAAIAVFLPVAAPIGAVLTIFGQVLFWIGVAVLLIQVVVSLFRGV